MFVFAHSMTESPSPSGSAETPAVWVLTDDRPGNNAQVLGVAQALGQPIQEKSLRYSTFARLPNLLRGATLAGVSEDSRAPLSAPWPDLVIAAGRRSAPVVRWIKGQSGGKTKLVQLMFPGRAGRRDFDLIVVPEHDDNAAVEGWPNVLSIVGAPSLITPSLLEDEAVRWRDRFDSLPRPYMALIVGGATRRRPFSREQASELGAQVSRLAKASGGSVLLTTSRRTGREAEQALIQSIPEPRSTFLWGQAGENPYLGYLALADAIIVTGDSVAMCAEACATETPVYIHAPHGSVSAKHARLHQRLYDLGHARPLADIGEEGLKDWSHPSLNPAHDIAESIKRLMAEQSVKG